MIFNKIVTFILVMFSIPVFSDDSESYRYGAGVGISSYDTTEGESTVFDGRSLYFSWRANEKTNRLTLRESTHGLQVLTPVNVRKAQRNWDVEYSWDEFGYSNKVINMYLAPLVGGKIKEKLTVTCRDQERVCFDSYISDWKIKDKKQQLRPLIGLNSGIRIKLLHVVANANVLLKTDFEDTYYGIEITLGGEQ